MTHPTTDELYEALGPAITTLDPQRVLRDWLDGPASLLGEVDDVVRDSDAGIGWAAELTSEGSHRLAWTGQLLGVVVPDGLTDAEKRALIQDRPAFRRGTVGALHASVLPHLTGSKYVEITERDGGAYRLTVRTYTEETPDPTAAEAALQAAKPAGLVLLFQTITMTTYTALEGESAQTYTALEATAAETYDALEG